MPKPELLETFPNPFPARPFRIHMDCDEFTSLCPMGGIETDAAELKQLEGGAPDFGIIRITYVPGDVCIELKSLKLYFWSYRSEGAFHEKVTNTIVDDIVRAIAPRFIRVHADWYVRGGIRTYVTVEHRKKGWRPQPVVQLPAGD